MNVDMQSELDLFVSLVEEVAEDDYDTEMEDASLSLGETEQTQMASAQGGISDSETTGLWMAFRFSKPISGDVFHDAYLLYQARGGEGLLPEPSEKEDATHVIELRFSQFL